MQAQTKSQHHDAPTKHVKPALSIARSPALSNEHTSVGHPSPERQVDPLIMVTVAGAIMFALLALAASFA